MENTYYDITKEYPDMFRVTIYKTPYTPKSKDSKTKTTVKMDFGETNIDRSIRRTRRTLHDYVRCNDFDMFITFTFDPKKINRYDLDFTYLKMRQWLNNQGRKDPNFKYLIVPEKHKDGAIHFHALVQNAPFRMKKSNVIQDSRRVWNVLSFTYGFTNATYLPIDDDDAKDKAGNYIAKYITKEMITIHGKHRYFASRNLLKPETYYNAIYDIGIGQHLNHKTAVHETDYNVVHEMLKRDLFDK